MNEKFKHGGAPSKSEDEVLNKRLSIRFKTNDLKRLNSILKQKGLRRTDFCRTVIIHGIDRLISDQSFQKLGQIRFEIRKIGVNINQLAFRTNQQNSRGFTTSDHEILKLLDYKLNEILLYISNLQTLNNKKHDRKNNSSDKIQSHHK